MASKEISHKGKVLSSCDGVVSVEITSSSACASCHASGLCGLGESVRKTVDVRDSGHYLPGQEVEVCLAHRMGLKAVLLSYVIPERIRSKNIIYKLARSYVKRTKLLDRFLIFELILSSLISNIILIYLMGIYPIGKVDG